MNDQNEPSTLPTPEEAIAALQRENAALEERLKQIEALATRSYIGGETAIAVRLTNYENGFWRFVSRASQILSPIAVLVAVLGFAVTTYSFTKQIEQISATTVYQLAREGRQLGRELESEVAKTGEGISFHFSAQHLVDEEVVGDDIYLLYLVDYCEFVFGRKDFKQIWASIQKFYPDSFVTQTNSILALSNSEACNITNMKTMR